MCVKLSVLPESPFCVKLLLLLFCRRHRPSLLAELLDTSQSYKSVALIILRWVRKWHSVRKIFRGQNWRKWKHRLNSKSEKRSGLTNSRNLLALIGVLHQKSWIQKVYEGLTSADCEFSRSKWFNGGQESGSDFLSNFMAVCLSTFSNVAWLVRIDAPESKKVYTT